jgi:sugar lactone lactonase YvrE
MKVDVLVNRRAELAEGPSWDEQTKRLQWVNILAGELNITDPGDGATQTYAVGKKLGAAALRASGGFVLATEDGFGFYDPAAGDLQLISDPEADLPGNRFNDGKCDPAGRFWAGTMAYDLSAGAGSLYMLDTDGSATHKVEDITISNGLAWSVDQRTMYYIDTIPRRVYAFDYDVDSGAIRSQRVAIQVEEAQGSPDGMTIDVDGMLWIAHYGGSCVRRWNPNTAEVLETIELPTPKVTCCTFGGDALDTLYITTAWEHMSEDEKSRDPLAGAVFSVKLPYQGMPVFRYGG